MKLTTLFLALVVVTGSAWADWSFLRETESATVYYFKKDSYKGWFGGVTFATLVDMKFPDLIGGEPYMSIYTKFELDCEKKKVRFLVNEFYSKNMKQGRVVSEDSGKSDWFGAAYGDLQMYCKK